MKIQIKPIDMNKNGVLISKSKHKYNSMKNL